MLFSSKEEAPYELDLLLQRMVTLDILEIKQPNPKLQADIAIGLEPCESLRQIYQLTDRFEAFLQKDIHKIPHERFSPESGLQWLLQQIRAPDDDEEVVMMNIAGAILHDYVPNEKFKPRILLSIVELLFHIRLNYTMIGITTDGEVMFKDLPKE